MPTIEIVSIGALNVPNLPLYKGFAFIAEPSVISHRGLFQDILDKVTGIIVHLGNKEFEGAEDGGWFSGALMEWDDSDSENEPLFFEEHRFADVIDLLSRMIEVSPKRELIFLSDYQFGPEKRTIYNQYLTISDFIDFHQQKKLRYNTLYRIRKSTANKPLSKDNL